MRPAGPGRRGAPRAQPGRAGAGGLQREARRLLRGAGGAQRGAGLRQRLRTRLVRQGDEIGGERGLRFAQARAQSGALLGQFRPQFLLGGLARLQAHALLPVLRAARLQRLALLRNGARVGRGLVAKRCAQARLR